MDPEETKRWSEALKHWGPTLSALLIPVALVAAAIRKVIGGWLERSRAARNLEKREVNDWLTRQNGELANELREARAKIEAMQRDKSDTSALLEQVLTRLDRTHKSVRPCARDDYDDLSAVHEARKVEVRRLVGTPIDDGLRRFAAGGEFDSEPPTKPDRVKR